MMFWGPGEKIQVLIYLLGFFKEIRQKSSCLTL